VGRARAYSRPVPFKRHPVASAFTLFLVLGILALVLDGIAAGVAGLLAMITFILACITALRDQDADVRRRSERTGVQGWFGGWF
jgi:hypothetical protein